jgi:gamma-glutamyltranspeptidase/glutathione hydrolase
MTVLTTASGARAAHGAVATAHPAATEAGVRAMAAGGNAVDAAVAAAWALGVCEPSGSGLGGQTIMTLRRSSGRVIVIDGHSRAPAAVSKTSVTRAQQRYGYRATTVPTTPLTLGHAQARFGRLALSDALEAAISLAEEGYEITRLQSRQLRWCAGRLLATPAAAAFLRHGRGYRAGERFRQPKLAACLRRLAEHGVQDFYHGEIARAIARDMRRHGGLLELSDLARVSPPAERDPISARIRGHLILSAPAPAGGPQLLHALGILGAADRQTWPDDPNRWYADVAAAVHAAFRERERRHRSAATNSPSPQLGLAGVGTEHAGETTHLCAADADGNVVSLTQSIQSLFGAKVTNEKYGFLYNNYLSTCPRRHRHQHHLAPDCAARSNAAPTLVMSADGRHPRLVVGAAGSRRIISSIVQVTSGVLDLELSVHDALALARVHPRLSGAAWLERPAASRPLLERLRMQYGGVQIRQAHSYSMGAAQALEFTAGSVIDAAADPRRDGCGCAW